MDRDFEKTAGMESIRNQMHRDATDANIDSSLPTDYSITLITKYKVICELRRKYTSML